MVEQPYLKLINAAAVQHVCWCCIRMNNSVFIKKAKYVITMDSNRHLIKNGAIAIEDDKIVEVGKSEDLEKNFSSSDRVIDASKMIVTPGLINAHCHTTQQLARGLADNVFVSTWIHDRIYPYEASLKPEDVYISALAACLEAVKTGTTYIADPGGYHMDQVVKAVDEIGIRAVLARSVFDMNDRIPQAIAESTEKAVKAGEEFVRQYNGAASGRVRAWFSLRTERMVSTKLLRAIKELAQKYGVGIESHVSGHVDTVNKHKEVFRGKLPVQRYFDAGVLGPNLLMAQINWLTDEEFDLIKKFNVKICHCPTTGAVCASGSFKAGKFVEMMEQGITVALGCDNAAASNFLDMIRVAHMVTVHRDIRLDPTLFTPETLMEMLTINGSKALLSEAEVGSLEVGKKADITLFDTERPEMVPLHNPVSNLMHATSGESANTVIVNGKIIMRDRKLETVDEGMILMKAQEAAEAVVERAGLTSYTLSRWLQPEP